MNFTVYWRRVVGGELVCFEVSLASVFDGIITVYGYLVTVLLLAHWPYEMLEHLRYPRRNTDIRWQPKPFVDYQHSPCGRYVGAEDRKKLS